MKYRKSRKADQEIVNIYVRGVAEFGVHQAERYYQGLISTSELLADNPHMARERTELDPPARLHPYRAHMIAYIVEDEGRLIVRVLNGRQDWQRLLS